MESFTVAAQLAQTHYIERSILDTCDHNVLDISENLLAAFVLEHCLHHTEVEAPNADSEHGAGA